MDPIKLLESQHREVETLFQRFESGKGNEFALCQDVCDALALHAELEEAIFYPQTKDRQTEGLLQHSVEEHLQVKRCIAELTQQRPEGEELKRRMQELKQLVQDHVQEEEQELFPKVEKLFDQATRDSMGDQMQELMENLRGKEGELRQQAAQQTDRPAPIE
jgi:hemerythrin superfamily protein